MREGGMEEDGLSKAKAVNEVHGRDRARRRRGWWWW